MRYLITGGAGFIGSALVRRIAADGCEVRILDDFSRGRPERLDGVPCEIMHGDVRDPAAVREAMHGCDLTAHLAYLQGTQTFYDEPRLVLDVAVRGMLNVLDACEATGCRKLLLVSSSEVYQSANVMPAAENVPMAVPDVFNPRYSYGGGKIASELMAVAWARTGVLERMIIARLHNVYGPDMGRKHVVPEFCLRMSELARKHPHGVIPFPVQGTGQETRSFCWIDDCTDQLALLLARGESMNVYHVGTMDERSITSVAEEIAHCHGRDIKIIPGTLTAGSAPRRCPDTAKIDALGAATRTPFAEGVARTADWYRDHD